MMMEYTFVEHPFEPVCDEKTEILILGTLPSVKSRENDFYYGHKQNRFWKVIAQLFCENEPETTEEKKAILLKNHIGLWDVIQSCCILGSSDSSIRDVVPTDLKRILESTHISHVYANGKKAEQLYKQYHQDITGIPIIALPSTSPANASWSMDHLLEAWSVLLKK